jgi:hypothetical protein
MTALEEQQWAEPVLSRLTPAQRKVTNGNVRQHRKNGRDRLKPGYSGKEES